MAGAEAGGEREDDARAKSGAHACMIPRRGANVKGRREKYISFCRA
jgi:hypothetical protein